MWECPKCLRKFKKNNQSHYCGVVPKTINEYIMNQEVVAREYAIVIDEIISSISPYIEKRILWSMPSYTMNNINIQFSVCKNHISIYVGEDTIEYFKNELKDYQCKKSAIYIEYKQEIPLELLKEIIKWSFEN